MFRSLSFSLASVNHAAFLSLLEGMPLLPYPLGGGCVDLAGVRGTWLVLLPFGNEMTRKLSEADCFQRAAWEEALSGCITI